MAGLNDSINGDSGSIKIGTTVMDVTGWDATETTVAMMDDTDTGDGGKVSEVASDTQVTGTIEFNLKKSQWPFPTGAGSAPHNTIRAAKVCALKLYLVSPTEGTCIDIPLANIESVSIVSKRRNITTYKANYKSKGNYTFPVNPPT